MLSQACGMSEGVQKSLWPPRTGDLSNQALPLVTFSFNLSLAKLEQKSCLIDLPEK